MSKFDLCAKILQLLGLLQKGIMEYNKMYTFLYLLYMYIHILHHIKLATLTVFQYCCTCICNIDVDEPIRRSSALRSFGTLLFFCCLCVL